MGNKLSCSCAPLIRKAYRYEDTPWQNSRTRDGHLIRLWAEVFHVSSSTGAARWQQVSEDLVPVNIVCVQDHPEYVFHITAYNSQVEKILDVRLVQPGTRLGQASECFVYWKDPTTGDTWGLNFTSPVDAKQFRDCCSPAFKFSRKASSSYSLKLEPPKQLKLKAGKRVPQSTPSSPSKGREPRCTCAMTIEQMQRARDGRARYAAALAAGNLPGSASTLPRSQSRPGEDKSLMYGRLTAHPSSQSVYDNVSASLRRSTPIPGAVKQTRSDVNLSTVGQSESMTSSFSRTELARAKFAAQGSRHSEDAKSVDYGMGMGLKQGSISDQEIQAQTRSRSKSSDNVCEKSPSGNSGILDATATKRILSTIPSTVSVHSSPDEKPSISLNQDGRKLEPPPTKERPSSSAGGTAGTSGTGQKSKAIRSSSASASTKSSKNGSKSSGTGKSSDRKANRSSSSKQSKSESKKKNKSGLDIPDRDRSPPSDNLLYDNLCYATTPSSSNENSDAPFLSSDEGEDVAAKIAAGILGKKVGASVDETAGEGRATGNTIKRASTSNTPASNSPTSKLLMEYEMHLRNALARGLDAESYSLHTFEALLTQSMENVVALMREVHVELEEVRKEEQRLHGQGKPEGSRAFVNARSTTMGPKSSLLPHPASTRQPPHLAARGENPPLHPKPSLESTDSRIYLTSSEICRLDRTGKSSPQIGRQSSTTRQIRRK